MSGGLWRNHPASQQQQFVFRTGKRDGRLTQANVLIGMLREARSKRRALELPEIMTAGIAQHSARFNELRARGFLIRNETERSGDGRVLSRYWLIFDPEHDEPSEGSIGEQTSAQPSQERNSDDG